MTHIISDEDKAILEDIQVAFKTDPWGLVEIIQIEIRCKFSGTYEHADMDKFSSFAHKQLETICAEWFNEQQFGKEYSADDQNPNPPPNRAA